MKEIAMRAVFSACALIAASIIPLTASAQNNLAIQPNAGLQMQRANILDGVWSVNGLGELTLAARADGVLEGSLDGRACHGQYLENSFALLCPSASRGPYLLSGMAQAAPPVATTRRSRLAAQPATIEGQIHQTYLSSRGHTEEIATLRGARQ